MDKKEFIELTGEQPEDFFGGDWENDLKEWEGCDHECTSDCRREGCNCNCGDFHKIINKQNDDV